MNQRLGQAVRPVIRFLRRKTVLALIFCLSFAYCILSLHYGFYNRSLSSGRSGNLIGSNYAIDYGDNNNGNHHMVNMLRRTGERVHGLANNQPNNDHNNQPDALIEVLNADSGPDIMQHLRMKVSDQHDRRVHNFNDILDNNNNEVDGSCKNSVQGKVLIADDRGFVCQRKDLQNTGCCDHTSASSKRFVTEICCQIDSNCSQLLHRYSCDTCSPSSHCCAIYEHCISCCMDPSKKELLSKVMNGAPGPGSAAGFFSSSSVVYASLDDHFDFCLAKCRTSSHSVQHENSYRDPKMKHCYGETVSTANDTKE